MSALLQSTVIFVVTVAIAAALRAAIPRGSAARDFLFAIAADRLASSTIVFAVAFAIYSWPLVIGFPLSPAVHDEFANLLAADTFLHGRLTNPTPPAWQHLQTFHELMVPSYQSKYPPAMGLFLAAGSLLHLPHTGTPAVLALAAVLTFWVLRIWLPPMPALAGGLLAATYGGYQLWSTNYWGAGPPIVGAALLLLAVSDAIRRRGPLPSTGRRIARGCAAAAGIAILANSRPLEGLIYCALVGLWCLAAARSGPAAPQRRQLVSMILWALPLGIAAGGWMLYFNYRVTGDALTLPYTAHARQYMTMPLMRWQRPPPGPGPQVLPRIAHFHRVDERNEYVREDTWPGFLDLTRFKFGKEAQLVLVSPVLPLPLLLLPLAARLSRRRRRAWLRAILPPLFVAAALLPIAICLTRWFREHYLSPILPALVLVLVTSTVLAARTLPPIRRLRLAIPLILGLAAASLFGDVVRPWIIGSSDIQHFGVVRADVVKAIAAHSPRALVLVREAPDFASFSEFVFNDADLTRSPMIFVHSTDAASDAQLIATFPGRTVWHVNCSADKINCYPDDGGG